MDIDNANRLDVFISNNFNISRVLAKKYIVENKVYVNTKKVSKPAYKISPDEKIFIEFDEINFVSRGGFKLSKAIKEFDIEVEDKVCIDVGSCTGGFTDCLLQYKAAEVYAVDVGTSQLHERLIANKKVISIENTNINDISEDIINEKVDIIVADVSFVSVTKIMKSIKRLIDENGDIIILIKPQFEVGIEFIKKGIVKNKKIHKKILKELVDFFKHENLVVKNMTFSPIKGQKGNIEYLIHLKLCGDEKIIFVDEVVDSAFNELK